MTTTAMPAIEVGKLRVLRGRRVVLPDLSWQAPAGQISGLIGPSGCGKTTLMRALVGTQIVAGGSARVLGLPAGHPALRARIGYVTQSPSVYGDLTVAENLRYFAAVVGVPRRRREAEVNRLVAVVDLEEQAHRRVDRLSGGQYSRVSLAAALAGTPELLVLDEPTVGLDPVLRRELWKLFRALAEAGTTIVVSSHVMDEAARCDRLILLREGRVLGDGTPADILTGTGASDLDTAFLTLVDRAGRSGGARA
ncbi:ABC transporter ATP-binding protein [Kineosporia sp. NBRC 101731]|uniref:ABC transporter ATP-binding protein n=1 Tax=Kineosporia sp. NBRC 101731 TaxID=3032199 RepID=UPI0024A559A7|nr:ABC transporter ATP-binding protein [Kineosporia sp. NBRC 101731]GLY29452.1 multidrug ABC transporter ATP-binding protein [Kineosporia sp. NBRC 101731]